MFASTVKARKFGLERPWSPECCFAFVAFVVLATLAFVVFGLYTDGYVLGVVCGVYGGLAGVVMVCFLYCAGVDVSIVGKDTVLVPCMKATQAQTRYCRTCGKSVPGLDHHCSWLNTCVGTRTYPAFYCLATSGMGLFLWHVVACVLTCTVWRKNGVGVGGIVFTGIVGLLGSSGLFAFASLWMFHTYLLLWMHMGTYDWLLWRMSEAADREEREERLARERSNAAVLGQHVPEVAGASSLPTRAPIPVLPPMGTAGFMNAHPPRPSVSTSGSSHKSDRGLSVQRQIRQGAQQGPPVDVGIGADSTSVVCRLTYDHADDDESDEEARSQHATRRQRVAALSGLTRDPDEPRSTSVSELQRSGAQLGEGAAMTHLRNEVVGEIEAEDELLRGSELSTQTLFASRRGTIPAATGISEIPCTESSESESDSAENGLSPLHSTQAELTPLGHGRGVAEGKANEVDVSEEEGEGEGEERKHDGDTPIAPLHDPARLPVIPAYVARSPAHEGKDDSSKTRADSEAKMGLP